MPATVNQKGSIVDENTAPKVENIFDVEDYLYKVFNSAAQQLGPNPDLSTPENRALATLLATTAASIADVDARTKVHSDEYQMSLAYQRAQKAHEERTPIGFNQPKEEKSKLKVVKGGQQNNAAA